MTVVELAARYGASAEEETSDPEQAYAQCEEPQLGGSVLGPPSISLAGLFQGMGAYRLTCRDIVAACRAGSSKSSRIRTRSTVSASRLVGASGHGSDLPFAGMSPGGSTACRRPCGTKPRRNEVRREGRRKIAIALAVGLAAAFVVFWYVVLSGTR